MWPFWGINLLGGEILVTYYHFPLITEKNSLLIPKFDWLIKEFHKYAYI